MAKSTRKSHSLLPEIFQTEKNKKFLAATIDQLIEPTQLEKLSGYVGQTFKPSYKASDVFLQESSNNRQNYQLEPTVTYRSDGENVDFSSQYVDIVNEIQAQGGSNSKHDRLFEQDSYSYAPLIDPDKFVNYRQYYWLPQGVGTVLLNPGVPGATVTISVTNNAFGAYVFNNKSNDNPDIVVYKGNTYKFDIDALGHPFHIKTQPGTGGDDLFDSSYVENNGTDSGTVTLRVPAADSSTTNETVLWYQCENHVNMVGRLIIKDLADEKFDPDENLIGVTAFTDYTGLELSNGMRIITSNDVTSAYENSTYYVEQVGSSITLVLDSDLNVPESYSSEVGSVWDESGTQGWDTTGFDNSQGQVLTPDYWTINRSSLDRNSWSRSNRWFHKSTIDKADELNGTITTTSETARAKRPIIEFLPGLELYNHGTTSKQVDVIDTITTDALSSVQGSTGFTSDLTSLRSGDKVVFLNDREVANKIYTVGFVPVGGSSVIQLIDDSTTVDTGVSIFGKRGTNNKGKTYYWSGTAWITAQAKTSVQQSPLFNLFDNNGTSISDLDTYTSSNFTGSTLFEIAQSTQGTPDTIYGKNVLYDRVGLINDLRINDTFNTDTFQYVADNVIVVNNLTQFQAHIHETESRFKSVNNWKKQKISAPQKILRIYTAEQDDQYFSVDHYLNANTLSDLTISVLVNGIYTTAWSKVIINQSVYVQLNTLSTADDVITVKAHSTVGTPSGKGYFETAQGLQRNPTNANIQKFTLGDMIKHFSSASEENPKFTGTAVGTNNSRDIADMFDYGSIILQHAGSVPLAAIFLKDAVLNLPKALRYAGREYEKFKRSIIDRTSGISLDSIDENNLDSILNQVNLNKTSSFAFYDTDMLAYGDDKNTLTYTVVDSSVVYYPMTSEFTLTTLSTKAVYVYLNNTQLVHGKDYIFTTTSDSSNQIGVQIFATLNTNDTLKIQEHVTSKGSFVPATPAKLGLAPAYEPAKYYDTTYQSDDSSVTGIEVVRGHDGSITVAYGDFRDDLLLEFEKRIYNNIKVNHNPNLLNMDYGFFRNNEYTVTEVNTMYARDFYTWTGGNAVDYTTNNIYQAGNDFTSNYTKYTDSIKGTTLKGHWRNIYKQWYDTDQPHSAPWEMLGFSAKPSYWDTKYGSAPYTKGNTILWKDIADGFIADGPRKGYYTRYVRGSSFLNVIPATEDGSLAAPGNAGILGGGTNQSSDLSANWLYGDHGPAETAWRRSSSFRFAEQVAKFLAKPARYAGLFFDYSRYSTNADNQVVYDNTTRVSPSELKLPSGTTLTAGYVNILSDYVTHLGYTADTYIANRIDNINVQLSYKLGGFSNKDNLQVAIGAVSPTTTNRSVFMPKENFDLIVYKSAPVVTANYSGIIIEKSVNGFKVSGYANFDRTFTYYPPKVSNDFTTINVGGVTESFTEWQAGGFYARGSLVRNSGVFYRALNNISSQQSFNSDNWSSLGNLLPLQGGARVKKYKNYLQNTALVTYGTEFKDEQALSEFIFGYNEYLESQGFVFDEFSKELNLPLSWDLSVKEFLFWTTQNWAVGSVITVSPAAKQLKFVRESTIGDDVTDYDEYYTVLQQDGVPINPNDLSTNRSDGEFIISTDPDVNGIYNADIRAVQKEHLLLFDNITSFSDVVYDIATGNRQDRVKLVGFRTAGWNGDIYTPGNILDRAVAQQWNPNTDFKIGETVIHQTKTYTVITNHTSSTLFGKENFRLKETTPTPDLLPNWDAKAESFRDFYSLETDNFDADQQRFAQHLIGYQPRTYFADLGLDETTQYKFYQGMIRDKGTTKPILRFKSEPQALQSQTFDVLEEYAFRIGDYGGHRTLKEYEFAVDEDVHQQDRQLYQFTIGQEPDTEVVKNVGDSQLLRSPTVFSTTVFDAKVLSDENTPWSIFKYPVAGYVRPSQVDATVFNKTELLALDVTNVKEGYTVWMANAGAYTYADDWDVKRFNGINVTITEYDTFDNKLQLTCNEPHGLVAGDIVGIVGFNSLADGIYEISTIPDSTDSQKIFTVDFEGTIDSTASQGMLGKFESVRINNFDSIDDIRPLQNFVENDYVFVDNGYSTNTGSWSVYQKNDATAYKRNFDKLFDQQIIDGGKFGSSIVASTQGVDVAVGTPGVNKVNIYRKRTTLSSLQIRNEITLDYGNTAADDNFGFSLAMTDDGGALFVSAPNTGDIIKLTLSATFRTFTRGQLITGGDTGATGRVLFSDPNNDYLIVKNTGSTDFINEGINADDSSSIVTVTKVEGADGLNQGQVSWITRDTSFNYGTQQTITAPNLDRGGLFGFDMAVDSTGEYLVISAPGGPDDSTFLNQGTVYVYKYSADSSTLDYTLHQTLTPSNQEVGSRFGESVDISSDGTTIVVGSTTATDSTTSTAGRVHVFRRTGSAFAEDEILIDTTTESDTRFGTSVQISSTGKDLLIGAPNETSNEANSGAVYHFVENTTTFQGDGSTVAFTLSSNIDYDLGLHVVAGSTVYEKNDGSTTPNYLVDYSTNVVTLSTAPPLGQSVVIKQFVLIKKLIGIGVGDGAGFGTNIFLRDDTALIHSRSGDNIKTTTFDTLSTDDSSTVFEGTSFDTGTTTFSSRIQDSGNVHVYSKYDTTFVYDQTLSAYELNSFDEYGAGMALANNDVYVGAPQHDYLLNDTSTRDNSGYVYTYKKLNDSKPWRLVASQGDVVDVDNLRKAFAYDSNSKELLTRLPFIDPAKGRLFPEIEQNISYKTPFDPAVYTEWADKQLGTIWFDVSKIKFAWYEQGDLEYRYKNWGALHPSSVVSMLEWTASDLTPAQWNEASLTDEGQSQGLTGTAQETLTTASVFDDIKKVFITKYYYWVANPTVLPDSNPTRTVTAASMATSIQDPSNFRDNYVAAIATDTMLLNTRKSYLNDKNYILHFETATENTIQTHIEHVLVAKGDDATSIPTALSNKFHDSLVGFTATGKSVPDKNLPTNLQYGSLNRPRQSWYSDRLTAIQSIVTFANRKLTAKAYAKEIDLTKLLDVDPIPNALLGVYDVTVDTDTELDYIDMQGKAVGYKVLVTIDSTAKNRWQIYEWNGTTFKGIQSQAYDTTTNWDYADWYQSGYDANVVADFVIENEKTRLSTEYEIGKIVKVKTSYDGTFRIYIKTFSGWDTIGIEDGTVELSANLYDYVTNNVGYAAEAYGYATFDEEAEVELRNILEWLRDAFTDDDQFNYNDIFFLGVRLAQNQQRDNDWVFKSSFVKVKNTFSNLSQLPEYQINTSDAVKSFLEEVLPFKTVIREENTAYNNIDSFAGDITDFDNKSYYDFATLGYVSPSRFANDSTYFPVYNDSTAVNSPWQLYANNFKYTVGSIIVDNAGVGYTTVPVVTITGGGGSGATATAILGNGKITGIKVTNAGVGYTSTPTVTITGGGGSSVTTQASAYAQLVNNKIRQFDTTMKFDRVNTLRETTSDTMVEWSANTQYTAGSNIRFGNELYRVGETFTSGVTFESNVLLADSSSASSTAPLIKWTATDRIHRYYNPSAGMAGLLGDGSTTYNSYAQLMTGLEYPGVKVAGRTFSAGAGYDEADYDDLSYDAANEDATLGVANLDQILDSKTFTTGLGQRAEDINVVGDAFISEYSAHAPEEVVPGGVYDTLDLKVFTRATDGASTVSKKVYYGDGVTKSFDIGVQPASKFGLRVFVNNQFANRSDNTADTSLALSDDLTGITSDEITDSNAFAYGVDYANKKINFNTAPLSGSIINIVVIDVAMDNLIGRFSFTGNGIKSTFNAPITFARVQQSYILVNGVRSLQTVQESSDSASVDIVFPSAPANGTIIEFFAFDQDASIKAFSEIITTEYTTPTDSTEIKVQLDPLPAVIGPFHNKVIVEGVSGTTGSNRYKLNPPQTAYYVGDGSSVVFQVPNQPFAGTLASYTNTEVYIDGILQDDVTFFIGTTLTGEGSIQFLDTPADGSIIAIVLKHGHDYEIDTNGILTLQSGYSDGSTIDNEKIFVTTFSNHDQAGLRTEVFTQQSGEQVTSQIDFGDLVSFISADDTLRTSDLSDFTADSGLKLTLIEDNGNLDSVDEPDEDFGGLESITTASPLYFKQFKLSATPLNSNSVFVTVNRQYLTANHDFVVNGDIIEIPNGIASTDTVSVTYIGGLTSQPAIGYRIFKDIINRYHYRRLSSKNSSKLIDPVLIDATTITVADASNLPTPNTSTNTPGVVFINKERIAYFTKTGNVLGRLTRATLGTPIQTHAVDDKVVDASISQAVPYEDVTSTTLKYGDGSTATFDLDFTPSSNDEITVLEGGSVTTAYTLASDSTRSITFDTAPDVGVAIRVVRKTGSVWYDQITFGAEADSDLITCDNGVATTDLSLEIQSQASTGLGLQNTNSVQAQFLKAEPADITLVV